VASRCRYQGNVLARCKHREGARSEVTKTTAAGVASDGRCQCMADYSCVGEGGWKQIADLKAAMSSSHFDCWLKKRGPKSGMRLWMADDDCNGRMDG
jgi:hypothetical protein